jgi:hypothetical protein
MKPSWKCILTLKPLNRVHLWTSQCIKVWINPFTAEVAIMRLLGSAPKSHFCDQRRRNKVTGLSDIMTLLIDLGCLYCKQTQRAFNVFKNTLNWLKIDSVDQKFNWLECGNFSQDAGTPGTESIIAFLQLAVKGLSLFIFIFNFQTIRISFGSQYMCTVKCWTWQLSCHYMLEMIS